MVNKSPYIVLGCGFCGTNAIARILRDMGVYIGTQFYPITKKHPYPNYEDRDWGAIIQDHIRKLPFAQGNLKALIERRSLYINWGFKAPNSHLFLKEITLELDSPRFLIGLRDRNILIQRMRERWDYTVDEANNRIDVYHRICNIVREYCPWINIEQQELLREGDQWLKDRIQKWCPLREKKNEDSDRKECRMLWK